jgi:uncharacterized protein
MTTPNKVVHFEIPADDTTRALHFYEKSFGWNLAQYPGMEYWSVRTTPVNDKQQPTEVGGINGGLTKRSETAPHPSFTIDVASIEKALATVEKNGGKVVQAKTPVGDMGFVATFRDTEGNFVGLWQTAL